jgi:hypothetical protein
VGRTLEELFRVTSFPIHGWSDHSPVKSRSNNCLEKKVLIYLLAEGRSSLSSLVVA